MKEITVGMFARSLAGHDRGTLYLICGVEGDAVYLADGRSRSCGHPKKKKIKHVQVDYSTVPELAEQLASGNPVRDDAIRIAIRRKQQE